MGRRQTIKLTQAAIDLAIKSRKEGWTTSECCPVVQALREVGFSVRHCGSHIATLDNGKEINLDLDAQRITSLHRGDWPLLKPTQFTVEVQ